MLRVEPMKFRQHVPEFHGRVDIEGRVARARYSERKTGARQVELVECRPLIRERHLDLTVDNERLPAHPHGNGRALQEPEPDRRAR